MDIVNNEEISKIEHCCVRLVNIVDLYHYEVLRVDRDELINVRIEKD